MNNFTRYFYICAIFFCQTFILFAQPQSTRLDILIKQLGVVGKNSVRIVKDPSSGNLYILENTGNINRVNIGTDGKAKFITVYATKDHSLTAPLGMAFGNDGTMYLVGTETNGPSGVSIIMKGIPSAPGSDTRKWSLIAKTVPYLFGNVYNHKMSGIVVNLKGDSIIVNSGARTDHGEVRDGFREVGLTDIILKLPVNGDSILLQDDREWLRSNGYLMAEGIRNDFDFAYSGNGDLFSVENSGDRDDPEEMNWIREGHHYGFPWRLGGDNTPQQFSPYDPKKDPLLSPNAWGGGNLYQTFSDDPTYPKPPAGVVFTEPVKNTGPDADKFRDTLTGEVKDASDLGVSVTTFSSHRSPDGIVFDRDSVLAGDLAGGAFVISINNGALLKALGDQGEDLLHVALTKTGDNYTAKVTRLISGFSSPLGIEIVKNKLYVAETGLWNNNNANPKLWEITLPSNFPTDVKENSRVPEAFKLNQNYPNPFNPSTVISYQLPVTGHVTLKVYDILGNQVAVLVNEYKKPGNYEVKFDAGKFASGMYIYTLEAGGKSLSRKLLLLK